MPFHDMTPSIPKSYQASSKGAIDAHEVRDTHTEEGGEKKEREGEEGGA